MVKSCDRDMSVNEAEGEAGAEVALAIGVDSGMLLFADACDTDIGLEETKPWWSGRVPLPSSGWVATTHAVLIDTGGDDEFPVEADTDHGLCRRLVIAFDEPSDREWQHLKVLGVPSHLLFVGDPGMAQQFEVEPLAQAIAAPGVWLVTRSETANVRIDIQQKFEPDAGTQTTAVRVSM